MTITGNRNGMWFGELVRVEAQDRRPSQDFDPYAVKLAEIVVFVGNEECACWFAKDLVDAVNARMNPVPPPPGDREIATTAYTLSRGHTCPKCEYSNVPCTEKRS